MQLLPSAACAFAFALAPQPRAPPLSMRMPTWVPAEALDEISEAAARDAFENMQTVNLELPESVATGPVAVTYLSTNVKPNPDQPPVMLVHGFDISSLEWRRLLPLLEAAGIEAYAPCVPGWGFSETTAMRGIGVPERRAALLEFHQTVLGGRPAVWGGASLGACIALDCYLEKPDAFKGFAAFDPAFFTDPPPVVPAAVGKFLLSVGISKPGVRASIAKAAYYVKEDQTEDAIRCGNLPLSRAQWSDDQLVWLLGGAYGDQSPLVPKLQDLDTLTLWGREDEVIPPAGIASQWPAGRLMNALPETTFRWVEASGHTPHLEQPKVVAEALTAFVRGEPVPGDSDTESVAAAARRWETVTAAVEKVRVGAQDRLGEAFQKAKAAAADAAAGK